MRKFHYLRSMIGLLSLAQAMIACADSSPANTLAAQHGRPVLLFEHGKGRAVTALDPTLTARERQAVAQAAPTEISPVLRALWSSAPAYVVSDQPFANGVIAKAVRAPGATVSRAVVISATTSDDAVLQIALGCLTADERRNPAATGVRTITIFSDDHYDVESGGVVEHRQFFRGIEPKAGEPTQHADVDMILRASAAGRMVRLSPLLSGRAWTPGPQ